MTPEQEAWIRMRAATPEARSNAWLGHDLGLLLAAHDAQRTRAEAAERREAGLREAAAALKRSYIVGDEPMAAVRRYDAALVDSEAAGRRALAEAEERGRLAEKNRIDAEEDAATWEWERDQVAATAAAIRERDALRAEVERLTAQVAQADAATNALDADVERLTKERDEALAALADVTDQRSPCCSCAIRCGRCGAETRFAVGPADLAAAYTRRVRAEAAAKALRELAKRANEIAPVSYRDPQAVDAAPNAEEVFQWLHAEADRIERGETT